jgi:hypothetical protein
VATAKDHLKTVALLIDSRGQERDSPEGERSMERTVRTFNTMTGHNLSTEEGWLFMVYLKHARSRGGRYREDDYLDAIGYEALRTEASAVQHPPGDSSEGEYRTPNKPEFWDRGFRDEATDDVYGQTTKDYDESNL